jgi:hypothetical protein
MGLKDVPPGACGAFENILGSTSSAQGLSAASYTDGPVNASSAVVSIQPQAGSGVQSTGMYCTWDGATTPVTSSAIGHFVRHGESVTLNNAADIAKFSFICSVTALDVNIHYFR